MRIKVLHKVGIFTLSFGLLTAVPMLAQAQDTATDDRWKFKAALYLWGAGIQGTTRLGNQIDVGVDDLFDNLNLAFMGAFEARKSKWSLAADVIYLDVSADKAGTIGPGIPANADVDMTGWVVNLQGARNVLDAERASVDILAGARYLDFDSKLKLSVGGAPLPSARQSGSVWDGVIGVKGNVNVTKKWYLPYYLDAGTGQSDLTWQATGGVGYRFNCCDIVLVYRHMYWDFKSDRALKDISFSGPALGGVFKFQ
jgi:hypothetical protein